MDKRNYLIGMLLCVATIVLSASSASAQITIPQIVDVGGTIQLPFVVDEYQGLPLVVESERNGGILTVHQLDGRETEIDEYVGNYWAFVMVDSETDDVEVAIVSISPTRTLRELSTLIEIVEEEGGWLLGAMLNPVSPDHIQFGALNSVANVDFIEMHTESHLLVVSMAGGYESVMGYFESGSRAVNLEAVYVSDVAWLVLDSSVPQSVPGLQ